MCMQVKYPGAQMAEGSRIYTVFGVFEIMPEERSKNNYTDGKFGYFGFTPSWLQWLNNVWGCLVGVIFLTFGEALNVGLFLIMMPQVEKRFNFTSTEIGMIAAANDIAAVLFGLFVSHYGNFGNKLKWMGYGGILNGLGLFLCALPHFIIEKYDPPPVTYPALLCSPPTNMTITEKCDEGYIADWYYLALFFIGQFIAGVGSIPTYSFAPSIFQESANDKTIPIMLALWFIGGSAGPLIAFGVSKHLLELYVDIEQPAGLNLTPDDPRWIGNWWLGVLCSVCVIWIASLFILGFPKHIPCQSGKSVEEIEENTLTAKEKMSKFPSTVKRLLTNWTFLFNTFGQVWVLLYGHGLSPFFVKMLLLRFGIQQEKVGLAITISIIPTVLIGVVAGSLLTRSFKKEGSGRKCALAAFLLELFAIMGPLSFLLPGCEDVNLAGWKIPYKESLNRPVTEVNLGSSCNKNCGCHVGIALPVCGSDNITYLSPCYAGCSDVGSMTTFANCSCILSENIYGGTAKIGNCDQGCKNWLAFLLVTSVLALALYMQMTPSKFLVLRCVRPEDTAFAFGFQYFAAKLFAFIPGPLIFGKLVDLKCVIWQRVCNQTGHCWVYDMDEETRMVAAFGGSLVGMGSVCYMMSWLLYKDAPQDDTRQDPKEMKVLYVPDEDRETAL